MTEEFKHAARAFAQDAHWSGRRELVDADIGAGDAAIVWNNEDGTAFGSVLKIGPFGNLVVLALATTQDATVTPQGRNADSDAWSNLIAPVLVGASATPVPVFDDVVRFAQVRVLQREVLTGGSLDVSFCLKA